MTFQDAVMAVVFVGREKELAAEFEVAVSTVERWATGISRPLPRVRKLVHAWCLNNMTAPSRANEGE